MKRALAAAVAAIGLLAAASAGPSSLTTLVTGTDAGSFSLRFLDGSTATVAQYRRPLVIVAFARWCTPCMNDLPYVVAAANRYGSRVQFLGIAYDETPAVASKIVADFKIPFPVEAYDGGHAKQLENATPEPVQSGAPLPTFPPNATKDQVLAILKAHGIDTTGVSVSTVTVSLPFAAVIDAGGRVGSTITGYSETDGVYNDGIGDALAKIGIAL